MVFNKRNKLVPRRTCGAAAVPARIVLESVPYRVTNKAGVLVGKVLVYAHLPVVLAISVRAWKRKGGRPDISGWEKDRVV